jgi:hypothetical protein
MTNVLFAFTVSESTLYLLIANLQELPGANMRPKIITHLTPEEVAAISAGLHLLKLELGQPRPWREYISDTYTGGGEFEGLSSEAIDELEELISANGATITH